jgi:MOSC domain-containing protein YiiM
MKTLDELKALFEQAPAPPRDAGKVVALCARKGDGVHAMVKSATITVEEAMVGDRWSAEKDPGRKGPLTLINARVSQLIGHEKKAGAESGDNLVVDLDIGEENLPVGTRLRVGTALLEVNAEPHTGCKKFAERFGKDALKFVNLKGLRPQRLRGLHAEIIEPGEVKVGDSITVIRGAEHSEES